MNEYIKYFDYLDQAEGYEIREVPFSGYIKEPHLALFSKRWGDIKEGKVSYDRYLFYTTYDGSTIGLNNFSGFPELLENVYPDVEGVMEFSDSVTTIGIDAFYDCSSLTSITIPNSVTSIGRSAFEYCSSLTSITIPNSVTSIGYRTFADCSSLTSITIPNSVTSIGNWAFSDCSSLTSVTIPESVTSIGDEAFAGCSKLTSVTINSNAIVSKDYSSGDNISDIFDSQVTEYIIGNKVKGIGVYAFNGCSSLTSVTIGNSVTSIGYYAFYDCSSLISVIIGNSVISIGADAFYNTGIYNDESNWENDVLYINNCLIRAEESISGAYTIKENTRLIATAAFTGCSSLTSITIPNGVTSIGNFAFSYCRSLTSIVIPESVTSIEAWAFEGCSSLASITIPNSVTSIRYSTFYYCSSLSSITIPNSVTSIGDRAFEGCRSLTTITCEAITPPTLGSDNNLSNVTAVYVPAESVNAYKSATNWAYYSNVIQSIQ